jgi:hypothetical protein
MVIDHLVFSTVRAPSESLNEWDEKQYSPPPRRGGRADLSDDLLPSEIGAAGAKRKRGSAQLEVRSDHSCKNGLTSRAAPILR